jgi:Transglutaminase-like superfamily/Coenzyme PQQ synthesis protein D (PqqD)
MVEMQVPSRVHSRAHPHGGVVVLNSATGQWHALNTTASLLWRSWQDGDDFEQAVANVASRYPEISPDLIRADAERLLENLVARDLLDVTLPQRAAAVSMANARAGGASVAGGFVTLLAFGCMLFAVTCARLPFRTTYRFLHALRWGWYRVPPMEQAAVLVAAVHRAARWYPGRAACLELSLAAVLLAALFRLRLDWCLGAAADPYRFHAWVETGGQPVPEPGVPAEQTRFLRVLTV